MNLTPVLLTNPIDADDFLSRHFEVGDNQLEFCKISDKIALLNFARTTSILLLTRKEML